MQGDGMGEIVSIVSQKGGVGKTTTAVNLSASIASLNYRVLLLDLDPQGHIAASFGYGKYDLHGGIDEALFGSRAVDEIIHQTPLENFNFIPYDAAMEDEEKNNIIAPLKEKKLKKMLDPLRASYDYIFIDCQPSLNNVTFNALIASDSIIVPIQCEYYALKALGKLLKQIRELKKHYNPGLRYRGFLLTMVDLRNNLSKRVMSKVKSTLEGLVFSTVIPRNVRLAEVPYYGKPTLMFDKSCKGAKSYVELAHEFLSQDGTYESRLAKNEYESAVV
jgi:chromosome partitioning protein